MDGLTIEPDGEHPFERFKNRFKTVSRLFQPTIISFEYHNILREKSEVKK
jgi:hypothetical protein